MVLPTNIQDFDEYIRQGEPDKKEKAYIWQTAIGLQAVDGLSTSEYLKEVAKRNIEGEITVDEVGKLVKNYYQSTTQREPDDDGKEEADRAAANIGKSCRLARWTSLRQGIFPCIEESLRVCSSMQARYVTMTLPRRNGC